MSSGKVTVRNYFKDEQDNNLIMECLKLTFDEDDLEQWLDALGSKEHDEDDEDDHIIIVEDEIKKIHPFDREIDEKIFWWSKIQIMFGNKML